MVNKGVIGAKITVNVTSDITGGTVFKIYYRKPDGTTGFWTAGKETNNTSISYTTTLATDLDQVGIWILQSWVEVGGWKGYGEVTEELEVGENTSTELITLTPGTNTWATLAEAETYFRTRLGASVYWNATAEKPAALVSAFNTLYYSGLFTFPATATQAVKNAQCEMALFLLQHLSDMDARAGLIAQGVSEAGIVQEKYKDDAGTEIAIPPIVRTLLADCETSGGFFATDLERNDDEDV